ncbi:Uncharacterised protein [uncultured Ruminococcus sp.]|nr:Uncharacterised protein [uncultured Ruminococcus sp.]
MRKGIPTPGMRHSHRIATGCACRIFPSITNTLPECRSRRKPGNGKSRSVKRSLAMRKRNHIIPLHLNKKELAHLEAQVKTSGLPREEFLRTLIMGAELRARPCDHHTDLLHKVAGLCNNANQLAKVANTYGEASQQDIEEMTKLARQVWEEVKENW